jgi:hypothetical protein
VVKGNNNKKRSLTIDSIRVVNTITSRDELNAGTKALGRFARGRLHLPQLAQP